MGLTVLDSNPGPPLPEEDWLQYETVSGRSLATCRLEKTNDRVRLISSMVTELIKP